ncbi:hypothetical protein [Cereibacter johrii]|uniref:hypothetical protein n=1 Tax=Cereibacter johrii TaxID=445629 RepID=UPI003CE8C5A9
MGKTTAYERTAMAEICLHAAHDGSLSSPEIVGKLIAAGIEGYTVDYRRNTQTFYLPDGDSLVLDMPQQAMSPSRPVSMESRWNAWSAGRRPNGANYSYAKFSQKARAAGCAGYLVSFPGRRVLYLGRTAEVRVEHFPG